jgi:hypothetical protein
MDGLLDVVSDAALLDEALVLQEGVTECVTEPECVGLCVVVFFRMTTGVALVTSIDIDIFETLADADEESLTLVDRDTDGGDRLNVPTSLSLREFDLVKVCDHVLVDDGDAVTVSTDRDPSWDGDGVVVGVP